jgi:hypothetical protein
MPVHFLDRVYRPASGPITVGIVLEVSLEDGFDHDLGGSLNQTITNGRHSPIELHCSPVSLWDRLKSPIPFIHFAVIALLS